MNLDDHTGGFVPGDLLIVRKFFSGHGNPFNLPKPSEQIRLISHNEKRNFGDVYVEYFAPKGAEIIAIDQTSLPIMYLGPIFYPENTGFKQTSSSTVHKFLHLGKLWVMVVKNGNTLRTYFKKPGEEG